MRHFISPYTAYTQSSFRDHAKECFWDHESELLFQTEDVLTRVVDTFKDRDSGDRIIVEYTTGVRRVKMVTLKMYGRPVRGVVWNETTRDKNQLVKQLLYRNAKERSEIAEHWTYGRDNWLAFRGIL